MRDKYYLCDLRLTCIIRIKNLTQKFVALGYVDQCLCMLIIIIIFCSLSGHGNTPLTPVVLARQSPSEGQRRAHFSIDSES